MPNQIQVRRHTLRAARVLTLLASAGFSLAQTPSLVTAPSTQFSIPLLPPNQMIAADRTVAETWQQTIAASAQFFGYTIDSSYSYRQIACPVAPNHLLLAYEATGPNGSISRFAAVVRRAAEEETAGKHASAEIIPILHAGVVPFVRAIANPHSIEIFNAAISPAPDTTEVLAAAQKGTQPLIVRSLCYLAMVGEEPAALRSPQVYQATGQVTDQATIHAPVPTVVFSKRGQMRQMISIRSSANDYQVWTLNFVSGGKLLSATRAEHPIDRTPLVLNANAAVPAPSAPTVPTPAPLAPPAAIVAKSSQPSAVAASAHAPGTNSIEITAAGSTVTQPIATPTASAIQPIAPQPSVPTSTAVPTANAVPPPTPEPRAPTAISPSPAAISAAHAPTVAVQNAQPLVKPPLPPPAARFYTNLPPPPSKFIPDSALKTPPHLAQ